MHIIVIVLALLALIIGPGLWVKAVMRRYQQPANRYPKTGSQVARELLDSASLRNVRIEPTESGDHYDPVAKAVRLSADNFNGRSLTAIAVAAHEVGHALQDARGFRPLKWRTRLVHWVQPIEKIGAAMLMVSPFTAVATQSRVLGVLAFVAGFLTLGSGVVVHLLTLPTELDASFVRALPLIERRGLLLAGRQTPRPRAPDRRRADLRLRRPPEPPQHRPLVGHPPPLTQQSTPDRRQRRAQRLLFFNLNAAVRERRAPTSIAAMGGRGPHVVGGAQPRGAETPTRTNVMALPNGNSQRSVEGTPRPHILDYWRCRIQAPPAACGLRPARRQRHQPKSQASATCRRSPIPPSSPRSCAPRHSATPCAAQRADKLPERRTA